MRSVIVFAVLAIAAGCVDPGADTATEVLSRPQQLGAYTVENSTIERHAIDSDKIELYTPGAREIGSYNPVTQQTSTMPARPDNVSRLLKAVDDDGQSVEAIFGLDHTANTITCRAWNGSKACHCLSGCCNNQTNCWCCG